VTPTEEIFLASFSFSKFKLDIIERSGGKRSEGSNQNASRDLHIFAK
jgi:hypothetical protein